MNPNLNRLVLHEMRKIFYPKGKPYIDWMGYQITEDNKPSYHHINKAEDLRHDNLDYNATVDNGAYLGKRSHEILHALEVSHYDLYNTWNDLFKIINKSREYPNDELLEMIYTLKQFTEDILYKNTKKH